MALACGEPYLVPYPSFTTLWSIHLQTATTGSCTMSEDTSLLRCLPALCAPTTIDAQSQDMDERVSPAVTGCDPALDAPTTVMATLSPSASMLNHKTWMTAVTGCDRL